MQIAILGSGSYGNGYLIQTKREWLLIECGIRSVELMKTINFNVRNVCGCIISHVHSDHVQYVKDYLKYGFPIYMTPESRAETPVLCMERMKVQKIGGFEVIPFQVPHNETDCDGFLIRHPEFGSLLYITDAEMCPYDMSKAGINHEKIECNYSIDYLEMTEVNKNHILCGHMELQTCKRFLRTIYSEQLQSIGLIHLSQVNGDPDRFLNEVQDEFPFTHVWVAEKNKRIEV